MQYGVRDGEITTERIKQIYDAAMDSVNLINKGKPSRSTNEEWKDNLWRNKEHLKIILDQKYWTTEDLQPFKDAVVKAEKEISKLDELKEIVTEV